MMPAMFRRTFAIHGSFFFGCGEHRSAKPVSASARLRSSEFGRRASCRPCNGLAIAAFLFSGLGWSLSLPGAARGQNDWQFPDPYFGILEVEKSMPRRSHRGPGKGLKRPPVPATPPSQGGVPGSGGDASIPATAGQPGRVRGPQHADGVSVPPPVPPAAAPSAPLSSTAPRMGSPVAAQPFGPDETGRPQPLPGSSPSVGPDGVLEPLRPSQAVPHAAASQRTRWRRRGWR